MNLKEKLSSAHGKLFASRFELLKVVQFSCLDVFHDFPKNAVCLQKKSFSTEPAFQITSKVSVSSKFPLDRKALICKVYKKSLGQIKVCFSWSIKTSSKR